MPFLVSGFGVFMMRQYAAQAISDELIEAARVDGCSTWRIYWNIVLPALRPAAGVLGLLTFMRPGTSSSGRTSCSPRQPDRAGLARRSSRHAYYTDYSWSSPARRWHLPLLLVFIVFGRQIIGGIMEGAVKS